MSRDKPVACFIGQTRHQLPLSEAESLRLKELSGVVELEMIAFSKNAWPHLVRDGYTLILLPHVRLSSMKLFLQATVGSGIMAVRALFGKLDVIIAQSPIDGFAGMLAKKAAALFGRKVALVVENHGDFEESLFLQRRFRFEKAYRRVVGMVTRMALSQADAFRAVSTFTSEQLERLAPGRPVIRFVAWTDLATFKRAFEAAEPHERSQARVCFVGALSPIKGVVTLLEAFAEARKGFPGAMLELIGPQYDNSYVIELKRKARLLDLEDSLEITGELTRYELAFRLARARVLVLPSLSEGLGRVILEAMACGVPVIGSDVGGIRDVVENGKTGLLVPPGDSCALAEKIMLLLGDRELAMRMGEEARGRVDAVFTSQAYREGYRRLIEVALEARGASRL